MVGDEFVGNLKFHPPDGNWSIECVAGATKQPERNAEYKIIGCQTTKVNINKR